MAEQERQPTRHTVGFAIRRHRLRTQISVAPLGRLSNLLSSLGMQLDATSKPPLTANDDAKGQCWSCSLTACLAQSDRAMYKLSHPKINSSKPRHQLSLGLAP